MSEPRPLTDAELERLNRHLPDGAKVKTATQTGDMVEIELELPAALPHMVISAGAILP